MSGSAVRKICSSGGCAMETFYSSVRLRRRAYAADQTPLRLQLTIFRMAPVPDDAGRPARHLSVRPIWAPEGSEDRRSSS